ncbi:MAG: hypothetical protein OK438_02720 [Thaumarchaeota archaeon]|nr:hypothetical protein [Nitrososphaerota archaeon]
MDASGSLRQTVTHLFDAVRYSEHAKELEEAAQKAEANLEAGLNKLESQTEEIFNLVSSFKNDPELPLKELSRQLSEFLFTAKEQAGEKLRRRAKEELAELRRTAAGEKDKATKSLEAYLAEDPLPIIETAVSVRLANGVYEARSRYECEGGMKYDFGLAAQNSRLFHEELMLSRLGYELKVPVRFSRTLLKNRVPGFERLDQYVLADAETTGGRIRANFQRAGNGGRMKIVTSGSDDHGFVGLEYTDEAHTVNVMNDPSLSSYVDLDSIKKATEELAKELADLAQKKVALLRLTLDGEQPVENVDCYRVLQVVFEVWGPRYKALVKKLTEGRPGEKGDKGLSASFIHDRLKVLGDLSKPVAQMMGL